MPKRKRIVFCRPMRENSGMNRVAWRRVGVLLGAVGAALLLFGPGHVLAQQSSSSNYSVDEVYFGPGGNVSQCSTSYCAKTSLGSLAVGDTKSSNYDAQAGNNTNREPYLEFIVTGSSTDLGVLSVGNATTTQQTFSVKTYLAGGYVVTTESGPPTGSAPTNHPLATPSSPTVSTPGTEQFGMNLVNNTTACGSPVNFGADPVQKPDSTFSFGAAASGYNTCGKFKYAKGDTVALSNKSSGETDYTASYLFNISNVTPSGLYTFHQVLVATSTY